MWDIPLQISFLALNFIRWPWANNTPLFLPTSSGCQWMNKNHEENKKIIMLQSCVYLEEHKRERNGVKIGREVVHKKWSLLFFLNQNFSKINQRLSIYEFWSLERVDLQGKEGLKSSVLQIFWITSPNTALFENVICSPSSLKLSDQRDMDVMYRMRKVGLTDSA